MNSSLRIIRRLIFLYFWLLIFEGALRFWILPGLSNVLLLVRDPVACLIYLFAIPAGLMPRHPALGFTVALALATGATSLLASDAPLMVLLYGLRSNFLHLPLIFIMPIVLTASDVQRISRWMMLLMIPMALLVVQQFRSPPGSLINAGGMPTHYGTVRPAGTFAFVSGMVSFTALVAAFLAHSFSVSHLRQWPLKVLCSASVIASLAVSGSRSAILAVGTVFMLLAGLALFKAEAAKGLLVSIGVVGLGLAGLTSTEFFEEGQRQLVQRFEDASGGQGITESSLDRFAGMLNYPIWAASEAGMMGHGLGTGTNVGYFLTTGLRGFGGGQETELGRIMYESGIIFGTAFILLRVGITLQLFTSAWGALRWGNILPILLFGACSMNVLMGTWGIANTQGFATFGAALCFASLKLGLRPQRPRSSGVDNRNAEPNKAETARPAHSRCG